MLCLPRESEFPRRAREFLNISDKDWEIETWDKDVDLLDVRCYMAMCVSEAAFARNGPPSLAFTHVLFLGLPNKGKNSCWLATTVQAFALQYGLLLDPLIRELEEQQEQLRKQPRGGKGDNEEIKAAEAQAVTIFALAVRGVTRRDRPHIQSWIKAQRGFRRY